MNTNKSIATIVEHTGVPARIESNMPKIAHSTEMIAEHIVTRLKLLHRCIAESAGNMTSADIRSEPTRFIASTMITAITIAKSRLYASVFMPVAFAKFSSNVTANNLL